MEIPVTQTRAGSAGSVASTASRAATAAARSVVGRSASGSGRFAFQSIAAQAWPVRHCGAIRKQGWRRRLPGSAIHRGRNFSWASLSSPRSPAPCRKSTTGSRTPGCGASGRSSR